MNFFSSNTRNIIKTTLNKMSKLHMFDFNENNSNNISINLEILSTDLTKSFYRFYNYLFDEHSNFSLYEGSLNKIREKIYSIKNNANNLSDSFNLIIHNNLFFDSPIVINVLKNNINSYSSFITNIIYILNKSFIELKNFNFNDDSSISSTDNLSLIKIISNIDEVLSKEKYITNSKNLFNFIKDDLLSIDSSLLETFNESKELLDKIPIESNILPFDRDDFIFVFKHIEKRRNLITDCYNKLSEIYSFGDSLSISIFEFEYKNLKNLSNNLKSSLFLSYSKYLSQGRI